MGAAWLAARAGMRGQARALAVLTLLVGIVGGSVLVALAGSRRVETAFDRLTEATGSSNLEVSFEEPVDATVLEPLRDVDGIEAATLGAFVGAAPEEAGLVPFRDVIAISTIARFGQDVNGGRVVAGRMLEDDALEVMLNQAMAELTGLRPGDRTELLTVLPETALASLLGEGDIDRADGPRIPVEVAGVLHAPEDISDADGPATYVSRAVATADGVASFPVVVFLHVEGTRISEVAERIAPLFPDGTVAPTDPFRDRIQSGLDAQALALGVLGLAIAAAASVTIALAVQRATASSSADDAVLRAIGMAASERRAVAALRVVVVASVGTVLAMAGGILLGPIAITGLARQAEPSPPRWIDPLVGLLVAGGLLLLVVGVAAVGARPRAPRPRREASLLERALVALRLPVDVAMGTRRALAAESQGGSGRAALAGVVAGVLAVVGVLTFDASVDRLLRSPEQWGAVFDAAVIPGSTPSAYEAAIDDLAADDSVDAVSRTGEATVTLTTPSGDLFVVPIDHAEAVKGALAPYLVTDGADLRTDQEALVGSEILERMDLAVGDELTIDTADGPSRLTIAGRAVVYNTDRIDYSIVVTPRAAEALGIVDDEDETNLLVRFADGVDPVAGTEALAERFDNVGAIVPPSTIDNLDELGLLPSVLAMVVAALGCAAIAYGLTSSVRRSRRELATVRAIGASRAMLVRSVIAQAGVLVIVGLVLGIPLGITAGRSAYLVVARSTGAVPVLEVPSAAIALVAVVALGLALLLGAPPAVRVARTRAASFLRVP